mmetsp:Transcript_37816/g.119287  ORF Transcript_37816/g.119287 Transcript_37816/m.119287 type:complete len:220 (-) Transcript_37816:123-782(-)
MGGVDREGGAAVRHTLPQRAHHQPRGRAVADVGRVRGREDDRFRIELYGVRVLPLPELLISLLLEGLGGLLGCGPRPRPRGPWPRAGGGAGRLGGRVCAHVGLAVGEVVRHLRVVPPPAAASHRAGALHRGQHPPGKRRLGLEECKLVADEVGLARRARRGRSRLLQVLEPVLEACLAEDVRAMRVNGVVVHQVLTDFADKLLVVRLSRDHASHLEAHA